MSDKHWHRVMARRRKVAMQMMGSGNSPYAECIIYESFMNLSALDE